jgi:hypothetical protein
MELSMISLFKFTLLFALSSFSISVNADVLKYGDQYIVQKEMYPGNLAWCTEFIGFPEIAGVSAEINQSFMWDNVPMVGQMKYPGNCVIKVYATDLNSVLGLKFGIGVSRTEGGKIKEIKEVEITAMDLR